MYIYLHNKTRRWINVIENAPTESKMLYAPSMFQTVISTHFHGEWKIFKIDNMEINNLDILLIYVTLFQHWKLVFNVLVKNKNKNEFNHDYRDRWLYG